MNFTRNVVTELMSKNINVEGEEYYALLQAYAAKIASLQGREIEENFDMLKKAQALCVKRNDLTKNEMMEHLMFYLENVDDVVREIALSSQSEEQKILALNDYALSIACSGEYQSSFAQYRRSGFVEERLEGEKLVYADMKEDYQRLSVMKYDDEVLAALIAKYPAQEEGKSGVIEKALCRIDEQENDFFARQMKFLKATINFLVDDEARMRMEQKLQANL